jgi:hypothetical protein
MDGNDEWFRARDEEAQLAYFWRDPERRSKEDRLLLKYWREVGGLIITEVPIGRDGPREWPPGAKQGRIDGVRLVAHPRLSPSDGIHTFARDTKGTIPMTEILIAGAQVEVIEVKQLLNQHVLGQVIAGADLLEMEYAPAQVDPIVVCALGDPALEAVCERRSIAVFVSSAE